MTSFRIYCNGVDHQVILGVLRRNLCKRAFDVYWSVRSGAHGFCGRRGGWTTRDVRPVNRLLSFSQPYKLHVGCGQVYFPGWVNIDANAATKADVNWDIRHGLLAPDASCQYVYNEHVLEHLPVEAGLTFLRECRRVLAPGGVLRVAMPSLDAIIEKSANGTSAESRLVDLAGT